MQSIWDSSGEVLQKICVVHFGEGEKNGFKDVGRLGGLRVRDLRLRTSDSGFRV